MLNSCQTQWTCSTIVSKIGINKYKKRKQIAFAAIYDSCDSFKLNWLNAKRGLSPQDFQRNKSSVDHCAANVLHIAGVYQCLRLLPPIARYPYVMCEYLLSHSRTLSLSFSLAVSVCACVGLNWCRALDLFLFADHSVANAYSFGHTASWRSRISVNPLTVCCDNCQLQLRIAIRSCTYSSQLSRASRTRFN